MRKIKTWSTPVVAEEKKLIPCGLCGGQSFKASLSCDGFSYVRCRACGLVQINPQPLEAEIKKRYREDYLPYELDNEDAFLNLQLLALRDADFPDYEKRLFSINKKPRVLDLGCATGSLLVRLRDRGWETTGVEISGAQAEYGRRLRGLDIRDLPLEQNRFPSGSFDTVLASHLIEHVNDPGALVHEIHRILAADGRLFITTPNMAGFQARLFRGRWRSAIFDHLYLFSDKTLKRLLKEKGFTVEKTASWGGLAAGLALWPIKKVFDRAAKLFGFGDVMIMRARRRDSPEKSG